MTQLWHNHSCIRQAHPEYKVEELVKNNLHLYEFIFKVLPEHGIESVQVLVLKQVLIGTPIRPEVVVQADLMFRTRLIHLYFQGMTMMKRCLMMNLKHQVLIDYFSGEKRLKNVVRKKMKTSWMSLNQSNPVNHGMLLILLLLQ